MKIELIQGDTSCIYKFQRKDDNGEVIKIKAKKVWITFKETPKDNDFKFQKTLDNGVDYSEKDNYYRFKIASEDTAELPYGIYGFDIAILNEADEKKTLLNNGILEIVKHYTHKENEV